MSRQHQVEIMYATPIFLQKEVSESFSQNMQTLCLSLSPPLYLHLFHLASHNADGSVKNCALNSISEFSP